MSTTWQVSECQPEPLPGCTRPFTAAYGCPRHIRHGRGQLRHGPQLASPTAESQSLASLPPIATERDIELLSDWWFDSRIGQSLEIVGQIRPDWEALISIADDANSRVTGAELVDYGCPRDMTHSRSDPETGSACSDIGDRAELSRRPPRLYAAAEPNLPEGL